MSLNFMIASGRLIKDPTVKYAPSGVCICTFVLHTVVGNYVDKEGKPKHEVEFVNVICYGKKGELAAEWLKKGQGVVIQGHTKTNKWQYQGLWYTRTQLVCKQMDFAARPNKKRKREEGQPEDTVEETVPEGYEHTSEMSPDEPTE